MVFRSGMSLTDDVDFRVDYCETGSSLTITNSMGHPLISLECLPPKKLELLYRILGEEIARGPRKSQLTTERKSGGTVAFHPEGI